MSRRLGERLVLEGELVARTALHVGRGVPDNATDMPLLLDGRRRPYLPGSSLTGVFRAWALQGFDEELAALVFGWQRGEDEPRDDSEGAASRLVVEDARLLSDIGAGVVLRDHVSIDRAIGGTVPGRRFDRAVLPAGSQLTFRMALDVPADGTGDTARALFGHLAKALCQGEFRIGAGKSRGLGRIALAEGRRLTRHALDTRLGMLAYLRQGTDRQGHAEELGIDALVSGAKAPRSRPRLVVEFDWRPLTPVLVKADRDGLALDVMPLTARVLTDRSAGPPITHERPLLPGSSLAGVMRTQAERIVRTVFKLKDADNPAETHVAFERQIEKPPLIAEVFGRSARHEARTSLGRISALAVEDCLSRIAVTRTEWDALLDAKELTELDAVLMRLPLHRPPFHQLAPALHVAIDRWTGGAAEGLLFGVLEPEDLPWEPIQLELDLARLDPGDWLPAVALLLLVLDDLTSGELAIGYGGNRGQGEIAIAAVRLEGHGLEHGLAAVAALGSVERPHDAGEHWRLLDTLPAELRNTLADGWRNWIESQETRE